MPLAAVVCTEAISESFHNGLEYFNTFGGNPVCAAAGLAVMEIIEEEGLQAHALSVGNYLLSKLEGLMEAHEVIGAVRGSGLFIGIEFVAERSSAPCQPPAPSRLSLSFLCLSSRPRLERWATCMRGAGAKSPARYRRPGSAPSSRTTTTS